MDQAKERLKSVYDPHVFKEVGKGAVERLADYLKECQQRSDNTLPWIAPKELLSLVDGLTNEGGTSVAESFGKLSTEFLKYTRRYSSPRYMGHQVPPPVPLSALFSLHASLTNQGTAVYEMSPFPPRNRPWFRDLVL